MTLAEFWPSIDPVMKIFEQKGKINFVDDNNVFVGYDFEQCCCESFGYFFTKHNTPESLKQGWFDEGNVSKRSEKSINEEDLEGYNFDTSFYEVDDDGRGTGMAIFRLTKDDEQVFLVLGNCHNGYYSHGFEMFVDNETIHQGSL